MAHFTLELRSGIVSLFYCFPLFFIRSKHFLHIVFDVCFFLLNFAICAAMDHGNSDVD